MKKIVYSSIICITFLFLLARPQDAVASASYGLTLWLDTLVPTLFPMMILSNLLIQTNLVLYLTAPFRTLFRKTLGLSPYGAYALLGGFLCGFPMGAKILADLYEKERISQREAQYLVTFCNNVSPAFLLNYLVHQHMPGTVRPLSILLIIYGAPLLYGLFSNYRYQKEASLTSRTANKAPFTAPNFAMIDACITNGIQGITKLGGYIILFSVLTAIPDVCLSTIALPGALLTAALEITTGIDKIAALSLPTALQNILLIAASVFGGLCTAAQSQSMLNVIDMKFHQYLKHRVAITAIACILAFCYFY